MSLKNLTSEELDRSLKNLILKEREILHEIILRIQEVDRRRLHLTMAYPSLFEYLTHHMGYSAGAAQRRIDAARLAVKVPEVIEKLQTGALTLSQISQVQKAVRQCQSEKRTIPIQTTQNLLSAIETKSAPETQKIISQTLDLPVQVIERTRVQKDDSVRFEMTLTAEQVQDLKRCREILSNKGCTQWAEVLHELAKEYLKRKDPARQVRKYQKPAQPNSAEGILESTARSTAKSTSKSTAAVAVEWQKSVNTERAPKFSSETTCKEALNEQISMTPVGDRRRSPTQAVDRRRRPLTATKNKRSPLTASVRRQTFQRDHLCQFKSPSTGKICGSRWYLQVDHVQPVWAGGRDAKENLQILCASHNLHRYRQQAGLT